MLYILAPSISDHNCHAAHVRRQGPSTPSLGKSFDNHVLNCCASSIFKAIEK